MIVDAARLPRWVAGFSARHGGITIATSPQGLHLEGPDRALADVVLPFLPWNVPRPAGAEPEGDAQSESVEAATAHATQARHVAVLLVRRGGYACAVLDGGVVTVSKVGSRYVQGRTAAGGWSQQRFAHRRENQTTELAGAAADVAARILAPAVIMHSPPAWLATGGDRPLVDRVLTDPRLRGLAHAPRGPHLEIGDPKAQVVAALPARLRSVTIVLTDPR